MFYIIIGIDCEAMCSHSLAPINIALHWSNNNTLSTIINQMHMQFGNTLIMKIKQNKINAIFFLFSFVRVFLLFPSSAHRDRTQLVCYNKRSM